LAAGAAHELNTPLATATLLVDSLQNRLTDAQDKDELQLLKEQLNVCAGQVSSLLSREQGGLPDTTLGEFLPKVFRRWHVTRPDVAAELQLPASMASLPIVNDDGLAQALVSLLNNAANANVAARAVEPLQLKVAPHGESLELQIVDRGTGLQMHEETAMASNPDRPVDGRGWGLKLSRASLERLGGRLYFRPRDGGGTRICIHLPLLQPAQAESLLANTTAGQLR